MVRSLQLGPAMVTFTHAYDNEVIWDKKKQMAMSVRKPISTTVSVEFGKERASAKSLCSEKDNFVYEKGRKEALKKCFAKMTLGKGDRKVVWEEYRKLKKGGRW
jgi:hypothetical protein